MPSPSTPQFEFLYRFPGWTELAHGRQNLIAAYSGHGNNIVLEKGDGLAVHRAEENSVVILEYPSSKRALPMTIDSCPSSRSRIERLFAGETTWTLLPRGRRSLANEKAVGLGVSKNVTPRSTAVRMSEITS